MFGALNVKHGTREGACASKGPSKGQIPNAAGREVVLFGPNIGGAVEKNLKSEGIKLFRNEGDLVNYLKNKQ